MNDPESGAQIRIDERKLLWGLVLVLLCAGAVGAVQLKRQADRVEEIEEQVAALQAQRSSGDRRGQERIVIPGGPVTGGAREGRRTPAGDNPGGAARNPEVGDEAQFLARKERIDQRLVTFGAEHALDDETAAGLQAIVDSSFDNAQVLRQQVRDGELDKEQRRAAFKGEIARRDAEIDALLGEELRAKVQAEVYKQGERTGAAGQQ